MVTLLQSSDDSNLTPQGLVLHYFGDDDRNVEEGLRAQYRRLLDDLHTQPQLQALVQAGAGLQDEPFQRYMTVDNHVIPLSTQSVCTEALRLQAQN